MKTLYGTGVALITPFKKDTTVDVAALAKLVDFVIKNGVNYLVVLGTTAETATLDASEKELVKTTITKANNNRVPMVLGIGGNNTAAVVNQLKTTNLNDYDAVLSVSPYYNKPTQEGIYQHFKAVATASPKPIILYNVPGRTASNILPETAIQLANDFSNIIGIKEAAGDMVQAMQLIQQKPKDFLVISGDDMLALPMVLAGGAGVISVIGEGLPKEFSEMIQLGLAGKTADAYALHYKVMDAIDLIFEEGNPAGIKSLLEKRGICTDVVRLPLLAATPQLKERIKQFLDKF